MKLEYFKLRTRLASLPGSYITYHHYVKNCISTILLFVKDDLSIVEILHHLRGPDETAGGVRAGEPGRGPLPHLAASHLPTLRELHHAPHHTQHHPPHVQGNHRLYHTQHYSSHVHGNHRLHHTQHHSSHVQGNHRLYHI